MLPACILLAAGTAAGAQSNGALPHYDLEGKGDTRVELAPALSEISGLALTADGRLLAHGDEKAVIWQVDRARGRLVKRFSFVRKRRVIDGDFEDIQVVDDRIYLVTGSGDLLVGQEQPDGGESQATRLIEGLGSICAVEGLAWDQPARTLLLLCKQTRSRAWRDHVVVLAFSLATGKLERRPRFTIPERELERVTGAKRFNGSALVRHPRTGTYILLAGPQAAYAEVDSNGRVLGGGRWDPRRHRQPEGIAVAPDLTLLVSDEAAGKTATITSYGWRP